MPGVDGYQKHHNIPQQLGDHPAIKTSGYDIHNSRNITRLPTSSDIDATRSVHRGSHKKYNDMVSARLDAIDKLDVSPEIKKMHIDALSDELGEDLRNNKIKLNKSC